ncbi:hypothetical protein DC429_17790 [Arthrobacter sp. TPD3018]|nr:hypothetical protein DC425_18500 [Sphingomonas sp. TPD3009]PVE51045.1 hypothetical protein DC429_17790 [Arthrobacter sp. TPD3018]PVE80012.1 hypothetical protein DC431_17095 [Sphingomonas melonis]
MHAATKLQILKMIPRFTQLRELPTMFAILPHDPEWIVVATKGSRQRISKFKKRSVRIRSRELTTQMLIESVSNSKADDEGVRQRSLETRLIAIIDGREEIRGVFRVMQRHVLHALSEWKDHNILVISLVVLELSPLKGQQVIAYAHHRPR